MQAESTHMEQRRAKTVVNVGDGVVVGTRAVRASSVRAVSGVHVCIGVKVQGRRVEATVDRVLALARERCGGVVVQRV